RKLMGKAGIHMQKAWGQLAGGIFIACIWMVAARLVTSSLLLLTLPLLVSVYIIELFRDRPQPFQNIAASLSGFIWISFPLALFMAIAFIPGNEQKYQPFFVLGYFIILWSGDSGAFMFGKLMGKHKLFPRISPNKTWEGSIGGLILALLAGWMNYHVWALLELEKWLVLSLIINITGTFGDFSKSMLKRSVGVKDSGHILPGHGGVLDRFDSLIGSAPFVFIFLLYYA
ncbi:MAG TPA: phosphatidate cytidylyltransferase, partial [Flavisolibacter sp.]